jgi:uncharacterized protein (DUF608 family)
MNDDKNPFKNYEIIARALEIAITLTKADDTWIKLKGSKDVVMDDRLINAVKAVARVLSTTSLLAISGGKSDVISGYIRKADKT